MNDEEQVTTKRLATWLHGALGLNKGDPGWYPLNKLLRFESRHVMVDSNRDEIIVNHDQYGLARGVGRFAYYYVVDREKFLSAVAEKHGREAVLAVLLELEP